MPTDRLMRIRLIWFAHAALLGLIFCLLFRGGGTMYWGSTDSDLTNQFYPWRAFLSRWFARGVFPYWDPHVFGGYPVVEIQQMASLNPVSLLTAWLLQPRVSLAAMMFLNCAICWAGGLLGVPEVAWRRTLAALSGVAVFLFGAVFGGRVAAGHFAVVAAMAWWPLAAASWLGLLRCGPSLRWGQWRQRRAVLAAAAPGFRSVAGLSCTAAISMTILSGSPQYIVYLFWIQAVMALAFCDRLLATALKGAVVWTLALLISAPQWLPTMSYLPYTGRAAGDSMSAASWESMGTYLIELLIPFPLGDDMSQPHLHQHNVWELCSYPGAAGLAFLLLCIFRSGRSLVPPSVAIGPHRQRRLQTTIWKHAIPTLVALLGLYLMKGWWLPGFGGFRESLKARAIVALAAALAASRGVHLLAAKLRWRRSQGRATVCATIWPEIAAGAACAVAIAAIFLRFRSPELFRTYVESLPVPLGKEGSQFRIVFLRNPQLGWRTFAENAAHSFLACAALSVGVMLCARVRRSAAAVIAGIALLDLLGAHWLCWLSRNPYRTIEFPAQIAAELSPHLDEVDRGRSLPFRVTLSPSIANRSHLVEGLYDSIGYDSLQPHNAQTRNYVDLSAMPQPHDHGAVKRVTDMALGRRFDCSELSRVSDEGTSICEMRVTTASIVSLQRRVSSELPADRTAFGPDVQGTYFVSQKSAACLEEPEPGISPEWEADFRAIVPAPPEAALASQGRDDELSVPTGLRPDEFIARVDLKTPAMLVYHATWLPGWRVKSDDGAWRTPLCANGWMLAAPLSAGRHEVTFRYRPVAWNWSLAMSIAGCAALLAQFSVIWRCRSRSKGR